MEAEAEHPNPVSVPVSPAKAHYSTTNSYKGPSMAEEPFQTTLELRPSSRLEVVDVNAHLRKTVGDRLQAYQKALYLSYHTTAGYVDERLAGRLNHDQDYIRRFLSAFQEVFPPDAGYRHDELELRTELSEEQKRVEPKNADSHLTFIAAGLGNCVSLEGPGETPAWFVDLDGTNGPVRRTRRTTVLGYHGEERADVLELRIPVSRHAVDSVNLKDPRIGLFPRLQEELDRLGIVRGRIDISLLPRERHAGLTVNEYETLLMSHDLPEVLGNPVRFMFEKGKGAIRDPRAIPEKTLSYARYDVFKIVNELMDLLGMNESVVKRIVNRFMAVPTSRFLRVKKEISLPVIADDKDDSRGRIAEGTYQSPILVQWKSPSVGSREVAVSLVRFH